MIQPTTQISTDLPDHSRHNTKRLKDTVPLLTFLRDLTINNIFLAGSLFVLAILRQRWQPALLGAALLVFMVLYRRQILDWTRRQLLSTAVLFMASFYLAALFIGVLFIGDPLIAPLVIVQSFLPILLAVLYELPQVRNLLVAVCALYILLIIGLLVPLPTHLPFNDTNHLI